MAIAIDIRDCAPRGRGFGRGFEGPGVAAGARPASPERCCAGPQPSRGMPRIQQERRCGRQETERIARNVRALFEWTFPALADATSLLGRWSPIRGKLETFSVGKNLFGACGFWKQQRRIQPFLNILWRRRDAGATKILAQLALVIRFRKNEIGIRNGAGQGLHRKVSILTANQLFLRAAFRLHALLFLPFHFFLALLKRRFRRSHTNLLEWARVGTAGIVLERAARYQRGSRGCRGLSR